MNLLPEVCGSDDEQRAAARAWISALHEPAVLARTNGEIVEANRAFRRRLGEVVEGSRLVDFFPDPERTANYLRTCSASGEPLIGALIGADGERFASRGSRLAVGGEILVLLRLIEPDERFLRLTNTVKELNALLRQREHEKAQLQEALHDRDLLHRELQHRVKNNMQMLAGLLHAAREDQENAAARAVVEEASSRFAAVAAAHQSLYQLDNLSSIPAAPLIAQITDAAIRVSDRDIRVEQSLSDIRLPNDLATPLALIVNELLTNACKHARADDSPLTVQIQLREIDRGAELIVADNGTGFETPSVTKRGSGLGLVRGLVRQLRGKLTIDTGDGAKFSVAFPLNPKA